MKNSNSFQSPKNKFRIQFNYSKSIPEIGSVSSYTTNSLEGLEKSPHFIDRAKRAKGGAIATIFENKVQYPGFDWQEVGRIEI